MGRQCTFTFRPAVPADLPDLLVVQERAAVVGLRDVFPQDAHPFPRETILERWKRELADPSIAAHVSTNELGAITGFAARRHDELLHFGTALETWGTGLAVELHDSLIGTFPEGLAGC
jgi:hypothetical protein